MDLTINPTSGPPGGAGSEQVTSAIGSSVDNWMALMMIAGGIMGSGSVD